MALLPMKMTTMKSMDKVWRIMELMKQVGEEEEASSSSNNDDEDDHEDDGDSRSL